MDLSTKYMGLDLPHPLMPGASPMTGDLDMVKRLEDAGAAAVVMHSLFEEQIVYEDARTIEDVDGHAESFAESLTYFPREPGLKEGPDSYLEQVRRIKDVVDIPLIASLNGVTHGGWLAYARMIEEAGADALEINTFHLPVDPGESGAEVEGRSIEILKSIKGAIGIPVAVKISPFYSSVLNMSGQLEDAGADAIVLFNRFYQPDIDIENLQSLPVLRYSDSSELLLRIRWLAILYGRVDISLAATGGIHTAGDALKALMAGADVLQMVSALLINGPEYLKSVRDEMIRWMEEHEYESASQMRGSMSLDRCPDVTAFTRANYMKILQGWPASLSLQD